MLAHALQAIHLLPHFQQMLKRPERNNDQPEFFAKIKPRHIPLYKVNTFARLHAECRPFFYSTLQHAPGKIKPGYPLSRFRQRHGNASRPAAQLQDGIAKVACGVAIERHILQTPFDNRRFVVIIRDERIVERVTH